MISRLIPRLDVKGANLVKGVHLEGLRVLGKPEVFARHYYEQGADELLFMDVVASLYGRNSLLDLIERTANEIFIPLVVGGGLRSLEDIRAVLRVGADKVTLNTAAVRRPELISQAARRFGSSTIVVSIEAIRRSDGSYEAYTDNGREKTGLEAVAWAVQAAEMGAGELVITAIDREGTGRGYDLDLTRRIAQAVSVPVIACGGAGSVEHVAQVFDTGVAAAAMASLLHYNFVRRDRTERHRFADEINLTHLDRPGFGNVQDTDLLQLKSFLAEHGLVSRPLPAHA